MLGTIILIFFPLCMVLATISDVTTMKIPNKLNLALLLGFIVLAPFTGMGLTTALAHCAIALMVLAVGFGTYSVGFLGAGDVKLLAVSSLWLGPTLTAPYMIYVGLIGGVAVVALMVWRQIMLPLSLTQVPWIVRLHQPKGDVPYGIALAPAASLVFLDSPLAGFAMTGLPVA